MASKTPQSKLRSKLRWGIIGIFALLFFAISFDAPVYVNKAVDAVNNTVALGLPKIPEKDFALGLDLQGGASLVYEADTSQIDADERAESVEGVRDVIERRVNGIGVGEPEVRTTKVGDIYRINVELPGVTDVKQAIAMIGATPILEFKEENDVPPRDLTEEEQAQLDEYNEGAERRVEEALQKVRDEVDFGEVAKEYSDDTTSKNNGGYLNFVSQSAVYPEMYDWASQAKEGSLSDIIDKENAYFILKRGGQRDGEMQVSASHILICHLGAVGCENPIYTKEEAEAKAQEIFDQANADNFSDLAAEYSVDLTNKDNGGDLGTFGRGVMVQEFEDAAFGAEVGQIIGPVHTQFGYHIIYKTDEEPSQEYELWSIAVAKMQPTDILPPQDPWMSTGLDGSQLDRAEVVTDSQSGAVQVALQFNSEGKDLFAELTKKHIGDPIAIFLDGSAISIPTVQVAITDGRAVITGNFSLQEARLLSQRLNAGALPVPVDLVSQQSVGATLGAETLAKSVKAGTVAIILVMIFMLLYYRLPGLLSVVSLSLYIALTLALFKIIGVTMTLAGIGGFILSVGMAVDANVLIFERLKEELRAGKSLKAAVEEGFLRAWTSIRDGNVSTLITCALLIWFGSSFVQGFAMTLAIGILISMFTAITITRLMLRFVVPWFGRRGNKFFRGFKKAIEE